MMRDHAQRGLETPLADGGVCFGGWSGAGDDVVSFISLSGGRRGLACWFCANDLAAASGFAARIGRADSALPIGIILCAVSGWG